jgi:hypothetical protein
MDMEKLEDSPYLLDLLIKMEDVIDSLDTYVFKNWFDAEIISGPKVRRYWLTLILKTSHDMMPDPRGASRLLKHGVLVEYGKGEQADSKDKDKDAENTADWMIEVSIPRRLITELNSDQLDFYDDEVDVDDVQDANDQGITDETGYMDPTADPTQADPNAPPGGMGSL